MHKRKQVNPFFGCRVIETDYLYSPVGCIVFNGGNFSFYCLEEEDALEYDYAEKGEWCTSAAASLNGKK